MKWRRWVLLAAILAWPALGGCAFRIGGGKTTAVLEKTTGEELADLKRARDAGAIDDEEYEQLKKVLMER